MCGIAGWIDFSRNLHIQSATIRAMTAALTLRGPDGEGVWTDTHAAVGHRRLAVIDIPGGRQPMTVEADGAVAAVLTYSGELYNFRELRTQLRDSGHAFRTASDTEVVLRAYLQWGLSCVDMFEGMYASASGTCASNAWCSSGTGWASSRCSTTARPTACCSRRSPRPC